MKDSSAPPQKNKTLLADLGLVYASAIWGSTFIMVKQSLEAIDPVTQVAYRFLLAALIAGGILLWQRKPLFRNFRPGLILGLALTFLFVPQTIGLKYTSAANSGFITGLFVAFVPPLLLLIPRKKPRPAQWIAVAVSLVGLWLVTGGLDQINFGDLITLVAAFTYALHLMLTDRYAQPGGDHLQLAFQQFLVVGVSSLLIAVLFDRPFAVSNLEAAGTVIFLALFPTLSAFLVQIKAQTITSPIKVSLIFALEPVFAGIFAWTVGGEEFVLLNAIGGLLVFLAVVISTAQLPEQDQEIHT